MATWNRVTFSLLVLDRSCDYRHVWLSQRSAWWTLRSFQGRDRWSSSSLLQTTRPRSSWWRIWSLLLGTTARPPCRPCSRRWPPLEGDKHTNIWLLNSRRFSHFTRSSAVNVIACISVFTHKWKLKKLLTPVINATTNPIISKAINEYKRHQYLTEDFWGTLGIRFSG